MVERTRSADAAITASMSLYANGASSATVFGSPRRVEFKPLNGEDVVKVLPAYHPLFRATDKHLLLDIDEQYAHGHVGAWAKLLQTAIPLVAPGGGLTQELVQAIRAVLP